MPLFPSSTVSHPGDVLESGPERLRVPLLRREKIHTTEWCDSRVDRNTAVYDDPSDRPRGIDMEKKNSEGGGRGEQFLGVRRSVLLRTGFSVDERMLGLPLVLRLFVVHISMSRGALEFNIRVGVATPPPKKPKRDESGNATLLAGHAHDPRGLTTIYYHVPLCYPGISERSKDFTAKYSRERGCIHWNWTSDARCPRLAG